MIFAAEPAATPVDLQFRVQGVSVRVSPWFWAAAVLLGWGICQSVAGGDQRQLLATLIVWLGVVFVSILVHEMGHALAYRLFGQESRVVLVHFGGITIPQPIGRRSIRRPMDRMLIAAAGPLAQLLLAAAVVAVVKAGGYRVGFPIETVGKWLGLFDGEPIRSQMTSIAVLFLLHVNVFWPLLNLLPVPPLDGGQIVREGLAAAGIADATRIAAVLGLVVAGLVAWWAYRQQQEYMAVLFVILAISCFQSLQDGRR